MGCKKLQLEYYESVRTSQSKPTHIQFPANSASTKKVVCVDPTQKANLRPSHIQFPATSANLRTSQNSSNSLTNIPFPASSANKTESTECKFGFSTKYTNNGLVHYRYRKYIPHLGSWLNREPLEDAGIDMFFIKYLKEIMICQK